jgi:dsRNA-specific ribonuclease
MSNKKEMDVTQYSRSVFPKNKLGNYPNIELNRNFTNESLKFMSQPWVAEFIANNIEAFTRRAHYFVIDVGAGIGGNTLQFLSRKKTAPVLSVEKNRERSVMFYRNVVAYDYGDKSIVLDKQIDKNTDFADYQDAVFFFDPPWFSEKGDFKIPTKGIKFGNLSLEDWLVKLKSTAFLTAFKVPAKYELEEVPGWTYYMVNIHKSYQNETFDKFGMLYICVNNKFIEGADETKFGGYKDKEKIISKLLPFDVRLAEKFERYIHDCSRVPFTEAKNDRKCKNFVKYSFIEESPAKAVKEAAVRKIETPLSPRIIDGSFEYPPLEQQIHIFDDLPVPSKNVVPGSDEWMVEFQQYIRYVLMKFLDEDKANILINGEGMMNTWVRAFTHKSYNPDNSYNYEALEFIGDAVCDYAFKMLILERFNEDIKAGELTNLKNLYMSEDYQPYPSKITFGFRNWVLISENLSLIKKIDEDVFESFIGALHKNGNTYRNGWGPLLGRLFIDFLGQKIVFNPEDAIAGGLKQRVNQGLQTLIGNNNYKIQGIEAGDKDPITNKWYPKFEINQKGIDILRNEYNLEIPSNGIIAVESGPDKKNTVKRLYIKVSDYLESKGLDLEYVVKFRSENVINRIKGLDEATKQRVLEKLKEEGYKSWKFSQDVRTTSSGKSYILQLIGSKTDNENDSKEISDGIGEDLNVAKIAALQKYLDV